MNTNTEQWREIDGCSRYRISNHGRIKNIATGNVLRPGPNSKGYMCIRLRQDDGELSGGKLIHRLVAIAFIPNPHGKPEVNHDDFDKENNAVGNLEWMTDEENQAHKQWGRSLAGYDDNTAGWIQDCLDAA